MLGILSSVWRRATFTNQPGTDGPNHRNLEEFRHEMRRHDAHLADLQRRPGYWL